MTDSGKLVCKPFGDRHKREVRVPHIVDSARERPILTVADEAITTDDSIWTSTPETGLLETLTEELCNKSEENAFESVPSLNPAVIEARELFCILNGITFEFKHVSDIHTVDLWTLNPISPLEE